MNNQGLVIGKFYPLHTGHKHLIEQAKQRCGLLTVLVSGSITESIPLRQRAKWVKELFPDVIVKIAYDEIPDDYSDPAVWEAHMDLFKKALGGLVPDVVFSSEKYGDELAMRFGAQHELLSPDRCAYPISGTMLREDPPTYWNYLPWVVGKDLCKRVVVIGAESTGTSTLAQDLARTYKTFAVREYGREFTEDMGDRPWERADFVHIAAHQQLLEDAMASVCNGYLICDTNALATAVWEERYMTAESSDTYWIASQCKADLYILTSEIGVEFEQDGTRDGNEGIRKWMNEEFRARLDKQAVPWIEVMGGETQRLKQAQQEIDKLTWDFAEPLTTERPWQGAQKR